MSDAPAPGAAAPIADPVTGAFPDTSGMSREVALRHLGDLRAAAFADPKHPLVNEHAIGRKAVVDYHARLGAIAYAEEGAAPPAGEQHPAPAPSSPLVVNEMVLAAFLPPEQAEAAVPQVQTWAAALGATQHDVDDALEHARLWARKTETERERETARNAEILRSAWGQEYERNVRRISAFLGAHGAYELALESGLARSATGVARLLNMAQRAGY